MSKRNLFAIGVLVTHALGLKAADHNSEYDEAQELYRQGKVVKAMQLYQSAAKKGHIESKKILDTMYKSVEEQSTSNSYKDKSSDFKKNVDLGEENKEALSTRSHSYEEKHKKDVALSRKIPVENKD